MENITAGQVANELRKLADALDKQPETPVVRGSIYFSCSYKGDAGKKAFISLAKLLPRPLVKKPDDRNYWLKGGNEALTTDLYIERSQICTLIEPAKPAVYDCPSILSQEEEDALGVF